MKDLSESLFDYQQNTQKSLFRKGNVLKGIEKLNDLSHSGVLTKIESAIFLENLYSDILKDYKKALIYSSLLITYSPGSEYFQFLHSKNFFFLGKYSQAIKYLSVIKFRSTDFFPFHYSTMIFECKSYINLKKWRSAKKVLNLIEKIAVNDQTTMLRTEIFALENFKNLTLTERNKLKLFYSPFRNRLF